MYLKVSILSHDISSCGIWMTLNLCCLYLRLKVHKKTTAGNTPLQIACLNGQDGIIDALVKREALINAFNTKNQVNFHCLAYIWFRSASFVTIHPIKLP